MFYFLINFILLLLFIVIIFSISFPRLFTMHISLLVALIIWFSLGDLAASAKLKVRYIRYLLQHLPEKNVGIENHHSFEKNCCTTKI